MPRLRGSNARLPERLKDREWWQVWIGRDGVPLIATIIVNSRVNKLIMAMAVGIVILSLHGKVGGTICAKDAARLKCLLQLRAICPLSALHLDKFPYKRPVAPVEEISHRLAAGKRRP
jgi:hypothetical protein